MKRLLLTALFIIVAIAPAGNTSDRDVVKWLRKKPHIGEIVIEGNHYLSAGEIRSHLYSRVDGFWRRLRGDRRIRVQRETAQRDSLEVMFLYLTNGFVGVRMREEFTPRGDDSSAQVKITIEEGRQFRYGPIRLTGAYDTKYDGHFEHAARTLKPEKLVNPFQLRQAVFDMKTVLANNGFPYAEVTYALDTTEQSVFAPVTFTITADSLVHFGAVTIDGLKNYPENVARRELKVKPGAIYRRDDILASQQRLYEAGYFTTLALNRNEKSPNRLEPGFILRVRERKPMYVTVQTGAAQSAVKDLQWDLAAAFGKRNFFGSRLLELSSSYSFTVGEHSNLLKHRYRLLLSQPWTLGLRMPLSLSAELWPRIQAYPQDYDVSSWSLAASSTKKFGREYTGTIGFEYQSVSLYNAGAGVSLDSLNEKGYSNRRKLYGEYRRDSRDNLFIPERGSLTYLQLQYVGGFLGGDDNFKKVEGSWASFQIVWPGWICATRFKGGWVREFGGSATVPRLDRFFLGGANTVRGFAENTLGPVQSDSTPDGANFYTIFNQEFRWKTFQVFQQIPLLKGLLRTFPLWQSVFFDMGNGFARVKEFRFDALAYSYGTGLQLVTPAGPIRVDYARVIKTDRFPFASRWHFTILYAF